MSAVSTEPGRPSAAPVPNALLWAIGIVLLFALAGSIAVTAGSDIAPVHAALTLWIALSYSVSGLVAWSRRPANRIGPLMLLTGFTTFASKLYWADNAVLHTVGQALDLVVLVLIVHVFLAYPTGRLRGRFERVLLTIGYVAAIGLQLVVMLLDGLSAKQVLAVADEFDTAVVIHGVELVVISLVALVAVGILVARRLAGGRPLRRSFSLLIDAFALGLLAIGLLLLMSVIVGPSPVFPIIQQISLAMLGLAPLAFLAGLLDARLARTSVGDLVMELRAEPADLRAPLAQALRDPSLELVYWLPQFGSWADQQGKEVDLPSDASRATTLIERDGEPVAALVHDPALKDEPELLDAVTAAAAIALENGRLHAELRANLDELRGSRARVLEAGHKERQRLERDLHDGAQQRLIALALDLGMLEARVGTDPEARAMLTQARNEVATSLSELRDVARGLHPAVLTAHGLPVALESLVARAPVPVRLTVEMDGRVAESVEVAAYYVVSESLANIGKHARATSATVDVRRSGHQLVVEVVDDGVGGADTERGSGLRGLADRVEAMGGRLRIWTPRGEGTRVRAELPCE